MTLRHLSITLDCVDLERVSAFWSEALGFDDLERDGDWVLMRATDERSGVRGMTLQRVPESKTVKNRMHLDVVVDQVGPFVERMVALGGSVLARESDPTPYETVVMADPEGNEFCVIKWQV